MNTLYCSGLFLLLAVAPVLCQLRQQDGDVFSWRRKQLPHYFTNVANGKLYACGQNITGAGQLYAFGFNESVVMNAPPVAGSPFLLANRSPANAPCTGALTEVFNQSVSEDWLFTGVKDRCVNTVGGTSG